MNLMSDALTGLRKACLLIVIDDCNHGALAINAEDSYLARAVVESLETFKEEIAKP
jgi:hypothetical protein